MVIDKNSVLLFDMDGTLVDTDLANFLAYKKAIQSVIQLDEELKYNSNERLNRTTLKSILPSLSEDVYKKISIIKEANYEEFLPQTKLKKYAVDILIRYRLTNRTFLVTNCRKDRALMILNYHNLTDKFEGHIFRQSSDKNSYINKYDNAISSLGLLPQTTIVFENEEQEIDDALNAGIPLNNIMRI